MSIGATYKNGLADAVVDDLLSEIDPNEEHFPDRASTLPLVAELEEELQAAIDDWIDTKKRELGVG